MAKYKYNPDTYKVHNIANHTSLCNFNEMDGDEYDFLADADWRAIEIAQARFSPYASSCQHCMH